MLLINIGGPPSTDAASGEAGLKRDRGAHLYNASDDGSANAPNLRAGDRR